MNDFLIGISSLTTIWNLAIIGLVLYFVARALARIANGPNREFYWLIRPNARKHLQTPTPAEPPPMG